MSGEERARGREKRGREDGLFAWRSAGGAAWRSVLLGALHNLQHSGSESSRHELQPCHPPPSTMGLACSPDPNLYVTPHPSPVAPTSTPVVPAMMQTSTMPRKRPWSTTPSSARIASEAAVVAAAVKQQRSRG